MRLPSVGEPGTIRPVETALLRFVSFGQIRQAVPHGLVQLTDEHVVLWVPDGMPTRRFSGLPLHEVDDLASNDWSLRETAWRNDTLRITRFEDAHSLWLFWRDGEFMGWYVNLQAPLRPTPLGWDTRDHALDIVVEPDETWSLEGRGPLGGGGRAPALQRGGGARNPSGRRARDRRPTVADRLGGVEAQSRLAAPGAAGRLGHRLTE
jgi:Protein of unknown function (DUF402)